MFDGTLVLGYPSTYIHRTVHWVAHMQTVVPADADGDLGLRFKESQVEMVPFGPPQSALPTVISMSPEQHERVGPKIGSPGGAGAPSGLPLRGVDHGPEAGSLQVRQRHQDILPRDVD